MTSAWVVFDTERDGRRRPVAAFMSRDRAVEFAATCLNEPNGVSVSSVAVRDIVEEVDLATQTTKWRQS